MQALIEWAHMDGYGGYVWSVLALLIAVVGYEIIGLKIAQQRCQRQRMNEFDL